MIKFLANFLLFFCIFINVGVVSTVYLIGYNKPICWAEKRMGNNGKYQFATVHVKVCRIGK